MKQIERLERVHFRGSVDQMSREDRIEFLRKRARGKIWMLVINVLAILFFAISRLNNLISVSSAIFVLFIAIFALNLFLIWIQWRQIRLLMEHYRHMD